MKEEIIIDLILIMVSMLYAEGNIRIFSDYFVARNPFYKGRLVIAKIKGFYRYSFDKQKEHFTVIEYKDNGKINSSVVQRGLRDKLDEEIAVLVAPENYTVRYKWYLPYELSWKVLVLVIISVMFWTTCFYLWPLKMFRKNMLISIVIGLMCGYLGHAKLIYYSYYSKNCIRIRALEGRMEGMLKNVEPICPMKEGIIEKAEFTQLSSQLSSQLPSQLPSRIKIRYYLMVGICILLILVDLWCKVFG